MASNVAAEKVPASGCMADRPAGTERVTKGANKMVKLYDGGVYLVGGREIIEEQDAAKVQALTGQAANKEEAKNRQLEIENAFIKKLQELKGGGR